MGEYYSAIGINHVLLSALWIVIGDHFLKDIIAEIYCWITFLNPAAAREITDNGSINCPNFCTRVTP